MRHRVAWGVLAFVVSAAVRPALAQTPATGTGQPQMIRVRRQGLIVGGAIVFGVSWVPALVLSGAMFADGCCPRTASGLWLPVIGPAAAMPRADSEVAILWSAAQLVGVVMFAYGMKGHDVPTARVAAPSPALHLVPMLTRDVGGVALAARW